MPASIHVPNHPLVQHHLAALRDAATPPQLFRHLVNEIAQILFYEATRDLKLKPAAVATPVALANVAILAESIALVPVLRAGLGMANAMLEALPTASVWHLGLYRDHQTLKPVTHRALRIAHQAIKDTFG